MTTPEAPPVVGVYRIVVCGTCNVVFMVHAGRPSCPSCGGDPFLILQEGEIPTFSGEDPSPTEGEAPAPAEGTSEESPAAAGDEAGQDFDEVERQAAEAAAAGRQAAGSASLQEHV